MLVPLLVMPLRQALNTREEGTVRRAIQALRQLVAVQRDPLSGRQVGEDPMNRDYNSYGHNGMSRDPR